MMRDRERLIARIRQIRRTVEASAVPPSRRTVPDEDPAGLGSLEARVAHLERLVEALQDSVYRETDRHSRRLSELEARIEPAALSVALSRDARERGL
jgi:hypothetical protein